MNEHNYQLETEVERSSEVFIEHFKTKFAQEEIPPVWMAFEVLSLRLAFQVLSKSQILFARQKSRRQTFRLKRIADTATLDQKHRLRPQPLRASQPFVEPQFDE